MTGPAPKIVSHDHQESQEENRVAQTQERERNDNCQETQTTTLQQQQIFDHETQPLSLATISHSKKTEILSGRSKEQQATISQNGYITDGKGENDPCSSESYLGFLENVCSCLPPSRGDESCECGESSHYVYCDQVNVMKFQALSSQTGQIVDARTMRPPCTDKCILSCTKKFSQDERTQLFACYWAMGSLQRQRDYLSSCVEELSLKYRRISSQVPRNPNCAFYLSKNAQKIRVCKTFIINTLGITERTIRTVIVGKQVGNGIVPVDNRGKHANHRKTDPEVLASIRSHINSIPRVESHYVRKNSSREYIDGGLTIAEMHRNYSSQRASANLKAANYDVYSRIFNTEFNIGFFLPKKDQCDVCEEYKNTTEEEKARLENYQRHQEEKTLSREEQKKDKQMAEQNEIQMAVYDLQAVLPVPIMDQTSGFSYKSRLNCYTFTVTEIGRDKSFCFFWHEGTGNRGVIEIGSCVLEYLKELSSNFPGGNVVLYSYNCGEQQTNRYIIAMYLYAIQKFDIQSITHKYLIQGHTQNEGDTTLSLIEKSLTRAKKSGPIYVPDQYIIIIRSAKQKGNPLQVREMHFSDFKDIKALHDDMAPFMTKDVTGDDFKMSEIKILHFKKGCEIFYFKNSYKETGGGRVNFTSKKGAITDIVLRPVYNEKIAISENKIRDLNSLIERNIIPHFYKSFYDSL